MKGSKQKLALRVDKLDYERESMYAFVEGLTEEELHDDTYGWSIIQVFSHLNDAEFGSILYMRKKIQAGSSMPNFSFLGKLKMTFIKGLLQTNLKWKAPSFISEPNGSYTFDEMKQKWEETREVTKKYVSEYPNELMNKAVYKHPLAGRLDLLNAIDSFIYHQRHHMHQLKRIKDKLDSNAKR